MVLLLLISHHGHGMWELHDAKAMAWSARVLLLLPIAAHLDGARVYKVLHLDQARLLHRDCTGAAADAALVCTDWEQQPPTPTKFAQLLLQLSAVQCDT